MKTIVLGKPGREIVIDHIVSFREVQDRDLSAVHLTLTDGSTVVEPKRSFESVKAALHVNTYKWD